MQNTKIRKTDWKKSKKVIIKRCILYKGFKTKLHDNFGLYNFDSSRLQEEGWLPRLRTLLELALKRPKNIWYMYISESYVHMDIMHGNGNISYLGKVP